MSSSRLECYRWTSGRNGSGRAPHSLAKGVRHGPAALGNRRRLVGDRAALVERFVLGEVRPVDHKVGAAAVSDRAAGHGRLVVDERGSMNLEGPEVGDAPTGGNSAGTSGFVAVNLTIDHGESVTEIVGDTPTGGKVDFRQPTLRPR